MEEFRKLGIIEPILRSIAENKFEKPSEIQEKAILFVVSGKDVIAGAATGSGKTLVFGTGIIKNCEKIGKIQSLVLVPTRELADQVAMALRQFSMYKPLEILDIYGGVAIEPQIHRLRKADVVVGTPGRILDHLKRRTIDLNQLKILVLDEADRMLDMGFIEDVKKIIRNCPKKRQTLLFSATISRDIVKLAEDYMNNPVEVQAESYVDPLKLSQIYYSVEDGMKFSLLVHLLKKEHPGLVMVFCNTQRNTDFVANNLQRQGIKALAIHGGLSQNKRSNVMELFHSKEIAVLVCTDVAARGLDIKGVSHVYNYDIPREPKQYIHRIGRTARAGKEGMAINLLASRDYDNFTAVLRSNEVNVAEQKLPEFERVQIGIIRRDRGNRNYFRQRNSRFRRNDRFSRGKGAWLFRENRENQERNEEEEFKSGGYNYRSKQRPNRRYERRKISRRRHRIY